MGSWPPYTALLLTPGPCRPHPNPRAPLNVPILQTQNLSLEGAEELALGHAARKGQPGVGCACRVSQRVRPGSAALHTLLKSSFSFRERPKRHEEAEALQPEGGVSSVIAVISTLTTLRCLLSLLLLLANPER